MQCWYGAPQYQECKLFSYDHSAAPANMAADAPAITYDFTQ